MTPSNGAVYEFLSKYYNGIMRPIETTFIVPFATRNQLVLNNPDRVSLTFMNLGANDIFISLSAGFTTGVGIRLGPNGGKMSLFLPDDAVLPSLGWFAQASTADTPLYVLEVTRDVKFPESA